jgi:hypothetical protein
VLTPVGSGRRARGSMVSVQHRAGKPVKLGDGKHVALPDGRQGLVESGSRPPRPGEPLIEVDPVGRDAERGELLPLRGEVLPVGAA